MTRTDIPQHVRELIRRHVDSVQQVEILALLRTEPERVWSPTDVCRALHIAERLCSDWLSGLAGAGLVLNTAGGFQHAGGGPETAPADELVDFYSRRRLAVVEAIYGGQAADRDAGAPR